MKQLITATTVMVLLFLTIYFGEIVPMLLIAFVVWLALRSGGK